MKLHSNNSKAKRQQMIQKPKNLRHVSLFSIPLNYFKKAESSADFMYQKNNNFEIWKCNKFPKTKIIKYSNCDEKCDCN